MKDFKYMCVSILVIVFVFGISQTNSATTGAGTASGSLNGRTPCFNNTDCVSGVCEIDGYCYVNSKKGGLSPGGIAALFFAFFFLIVIIIVIIFALVNKSEWPNWRPFNRLKGKFSFSA